MWKFLQDIKNDIDAGIEDAERKKETEQQIKQAQDAAFKRGEASIKGHTVISQEDGTVAMINQNQDQIEIFYTSGYGYGIRFPFGPTAYTVNIENGQEVKEGQVLVTFDPNMEHAVNVYSFTPGEIKTITQNRFRIS